MRNKKLIILLCVLLFLTLIIIVNSVLFTVKKVTAHCVSGIDPAVEAELSSKVIEGSKVGKGKSIFTLDVDKIARNAMKNVADIRVVNVERKFPNRVVIHYRYIRPICCVKYSGGYYICDNEGKIIDKAAQRDAGLFQLFADVSDDLNVGDYLDCANRETFAAVMDALDRLGYGSEVEGEREDLLSLIQFVDMTVYDEIIYLGMRSGVDIKILGISPQSILKKIHYAMSLYVYNHNSMAEGMIIVSDSDVFSLADKSDYAGMGRN